VRFDCTGPVFYAFWDVGRRRITQMAHAPNLQSTAPSFGGPNASAANPSVGVQEGVKNSHSTVGKVAVFFFVFF